MDAPAWGGGRRSQEAKEARWQRWIGRVWVGQRWGHGDERRAVAASAMKYILSFLFHLTLTTCRLLEREQATTREGTS